MRKSYTAALLIFLVCSIPASAIETIGTGLQSCGQWTEDRTSRRPQAWVDANWVLGFIVGARWSGHNDWGKGIDVDGLLGWIDNYCRSHPLSNMTNAAAELVIELQKR